MTALAHPQLTPIPELDTSQSYPLRRSPSFLSLRGTTPLDDIFPRPLAGVVLTFHLLQADGTVERTTQYEGRQTK